MVNKFVSRGMKNDPNKTTPQPEGWIMNNSERPIYQAPDGTIRIDIRLLDETVWLSQDHMAQLFCKSKKTISEHLRRA